MINNFNTNLVGGGEEDIKRFVSSVTSDIKVFLSLPSDFKVHVSNSFDDDMSEVYGESNFGTQPLSRKIEVFYSEINGDFEDESIFIQDEEYHKIFNDTECGVKISPVIKNFKYSLTMEISSKSKVILTSCLNKIRERDSLVRKNFRHSNVSVVSYIDNRAIVLLDEINKKRQSLYPGETLSTYIKKYRDPSLKTVNSGGDNNKNILGIDSKYSNIYGMLTTEANGLKIEYDKESKNHTLNLEYEVSACLPIRLNIAYPSLIFNQVINRNFIQSIDPYKHHVGTPMYIDEYDKLTTLDRSLYTDSTNLYISIPTWDTYIIPQNNNYFKIIFSALMGVSDHDPLVPILNLTELGKSVEIKEDFLLFLKDTEYSFLTSLFKSVFMINIYENDRLISNDFLSVDADLNVFYSGIPDVKKIYRLTLSICVNPNIITKEAYARAVRKDITAKMLNNILVINNIYNFQTFRGGMIDAKINEKDTPIIMKTVQTSSIQVAGFLNTKKEK